MEGRAVEPAPRSRGSTSKRYSAQEKRALLDEYAKGGETLEAFCARRRVSSLSLCAYCAPSWDPLRREPKAVYTEAICAVRPSPAQRQARQSQKGSRSRRGPRARSFVRHFARQAAEAPAAVPPTRPARRASFAIATYRCPPRIVRLILALVLVAEPRQALP